MYDDRYARRQARAYRRQMRRGSRGPLAGLAGGFFFIGLALAFVFSSTLGGNWFLFFLFAGLAFSALFGSASSLNPRGLYSGIQGFFWMFGFGVLFLIGFWPWILVLIGISAILGSLYIPITAGLLGLGIFAATRGNQPQYQQQQYQPDQPPPGYQQQQYQPYQEGYQPPPPTPGTYQESGQQYPYPQQPQPKQEYDQPQTQGPQEIPPQQQ